MNPRPSMQYQNEREKGPQRGTFCLMGSSLFSNLKFCVCVCGYVVCAGNLNPCQLPHLLPICPTQNSHHSFSHFQQFNFIALFSPQIKKNISNYPITKQNKINSKNQNLNIREPLCSLALKPPWPSLKPSAPPA